MPHPVRFLHWLTALALGLGVICNAQAARGRPVINAAKTTFVSDNGNPLRGAIISTETGGFPTTAEFQAIKNYGMNSVHCYAERWDYGYSAGAKFAALDIVVQRTRDNGLYLIITIGGGGVNASFNAAFWNFYAGRYANETHVIYEIQNEPAAGNPPYSGSTPLMDMELAAYTIIRTKAPNTPVLLMSYSSFQNSAGALQDMAALGSAINWNNAAIAFHGYGENGRAGTRACLLAVLAAGYPCFQTEFYRWPWGKGDFGLATANSLYEDVDEMGDLERLGISWLSFLTIKRITDDTRFKNRITNAGIRWTSDFGTWPGGTRSAYGNGGEPWSITKSATTRIQAESFDNGGQGVAYNDNATLNSGGAYRTTEGVDIQTTTDTGGGYNLGWMVAGEWMEYTTYVTDPGRYTLNLRVASPNATNTLRVKMAGVDLTGAWAFAGTGGNQTWTTISKTVDLIPGQQVLRFEVVTSGFNLNWIELVPAASGLLPNGTYAFFNRNTLKAVDVVGASTSNGAKVQQWNYGAGPNQKWVIAHQGANQYTIKSTQTGKAMDVASNTLLSGDNIGMWPSKTAGSQRYLFMPTDSGFYKIIGVGNGLAIEIADASLSRGARVEQREYKDGSYQQWLVSADHPATYTAWVNQQFPLSADRTNAAVSGATADPSGQGVSNLLRYALGLTQSEAPSPSMPVLTSSASGLDFRFRFDPGLTDVTYRVEASTDLIDWTETVFDSRLDALPALVDGWLEINDSFDHAQTPRRFLRLRILRD
ncbi:RICIN domain-containing protein [Rariglobus hedericola]|uniref:RICIN domain-containing protein n=1 Tax=Rariglobus hedericola TaxID=2597822 RepID=UPI001EF14F7C|nr:RICIN domain-containing protein [Rariglobus hedericola]